MDVKRYTGAVASVLTDLPATRKAWGGLRDERLPGGVPVKAVARPVVGPQCVTVSFEVDDRDLNLVLNRRTEERLATRAGVQHVRAYRDRRLVRIEFDLPKDLWRSVRFGSVRHSPSTVTVGERAAGGTAYVTWGESPNKALFGLPGSGKTVCLIDMTMSMVQNDQSGAGHEFVILNPKLDEHFEPLRRLPHLAIPMADGYEASALALRWAVAEMERRRDDRTRATRRLVVFADEVAELCDVQPDAVDSIRRLAQFSRAMNMNLVIASQVANPSVFGSAGTRTKDLFGSRLVFKLGDEQAWLATGLAGQKTSFLGGQGDALAVSGAHVTRFRAALPGERDYAALPRVEAPPPIPEEVAGDRALAVVEDEVPEPEVEILHEFETGTRYTARFELSDLAEQLACALVIKTMRAGRVEPIGAYGLQGKFGGAMATARLLRDLAAAVRKDAARFKAEANF